MINLKQLMEEAKLKNEKRDMMIANNQISISDIKIKIPVLSGCNNDDDINRDLLDLYEQIDSECMNCTKTIEEAYKCENETIEIEYGKYAGISKYKCDKYKQKVNEIETKKYTEYFIEDNIGKRYIDKTFEIFNKTNKNKKAFNACLEYVNNKKKGIASKGLLLTGSVGSGKTHLCVAIIHELIKKNIKVSFVIVPLLLQEIRENYNSEIRKTRLMDKCNDAEVLIIDDLGSEKPTEWVRERLFMLINYRYNNMLDTIITTNYTITELQEKLSDRIVSRIHEMCDGVLINDIDYRKV